MRRNYRIKLGLGYDEAKFNYLNNSQFSCFYLYCKTKRKIGEDLVLSYSFNYHIFIS